MFRTAIIAESIEWVPAQAARDVQKGLVDGLEHWRNDWESRDTDRYLTHYARNFSAEGMTLNDWSAQKRRVNAGKQWIKVSVTDVSMFLYPGRDDLAVVDFAQDYSSSNLSNKMKKRQYWIRDGAQWKILYEGAA